MRLAYIFLAFTICSQVIAQESPFSDVKNGDTIRIDGKISLTKEIDLSELNDVKILGSNNATLVSYNKMPHILKLTNCSNIQIMNVTLRFGVVNVGGPVLDVSNTNNLQIDNCKIGNYGLNAIRIDVKSKGILIENSEITNCKEYGISTGTSDVEIRNNKFSGNGTIGLQQPDLENTDKEGQPTVRFNKYQTSEYITHKKTVDDFVESRNTIKYNFDCFKIVKKFEKADGSEGTVTAYYEGENNKVLDKLDLEYSGPKGDITVEAYVLHENLAYTRYERKKGKIDLNYLTYGDFLEHLQQADKKSIPHISGDDQSNKKQYEQWLKAIDSWMAYLKSEAEEFVNYSEKSNFIDLPY